MDYWKEMISGSGKGRGRKKKHPPRRGMGVALLERIRTQQQDYYPRLAAGELPSFPNVCCCAHRNYSDLSPFPFTRLKKKKVNGEEIEGLWGAAAAEIMCSIPIHLGEGEGAKVLAIHQRVGKGADAKLVMEYGFFPASSSAVGSAAAAASSSATGDSSTSIDLSLRL